MAVSTADSWLFGTPPLRLGADRLRLAPEDFGPWQTVNWWFRRLLFRTIRGVPLMLDRERVGRETSPTASSAVMRPSP